MLWSQGRNAPVNHQRRRFIWIPFSPRKQRAPGTAMLMLQHPYHSRGLFTTVTANCHASKLPQNVERVSTLVRPPCVPCGRRSGYHRPITTLLSFGDRPYQSMTMVRRRMQTVLVPVHHPRGRVQFLRRRKQMASIWPLLLFVSPTANRS